MKRSAPDPRPTRLRDIQKLAHAAILRPLTPAGGMQPRWTDDSPTATLVERVIKPNDRLSAFERLEIYNRQYWWRLIDILHDDYPGIRAVLGDKRFGRFTIAYLSEYPSRSFTLRNLGRNIERFFAERPSFAGKRQAMAVDMARFEWAQVEAFDGPSKPPLDVSDFAGANPAKLRLALQPYLSLLELGYPLDDFLIAVKKKNRSLRGEASNAIDTGRHGRSKAVPLPRSKKIFLAVHRFDNDLYYKRLEKPAYEILTALRDGKTLAVACERANFRATLGQQKIAAKIQQWFAEWTEMGWFCRPGK